MSHDMHDGGCDERRDLILFRVAGLLEDTESAAIDRHLRGGCPRCAGAAAEARAILDALQSGPERIAPPTSVRQALMDHVRTDAANAQSATVPSTQEPPSDSTAKVLTDSTWWRPAAAAAIAAGLTLLAVMLPMRSQLRRQLDGQGQRFEAQLATQRRELEQMRTELAEAREVASLLHSRSVQLVSMQAGEPQPQAWGRIVWDQSQGVWQLYTFDMIPAGPDKTYELWFITADERKVPAGTFDVGADGVGSLRVALPDDLGDVALAAITDEPAGGVPQPTGSIQLVGEVLGSRS